MRLSLPVVVSIALVATYLIFGADMVGVLHLRHPVSSEVGNKEQTAGVTRATPPNPAAPAREGGSAIAVAPRQEIQPPTGGKPPTVLKPRAGAPDAQAAPQGQTERAGVPGRASADVSAPGQTDHRSAAAGQSRDSVDQQKTAGHSQ
jgi:hypothetical protein